MKKSDIPSPKCNSCIMEGKNSSYHPPPRFGEPCYMCGHQCEEPDCCRGIEGWEEYEPYLLEWSRMEGLFERIRNCILPDLPKQVFKVAPNTLEALKKVLGVSSEATPLGPCGAYLGIPIVVDPDLPRDCVKLETVVKKCPQSDFYDFVIIDDISFGDFSLKRSKERKT